MTDELVICAASLPDHICRGAALPTAEWAKAVNGKFADVPPYGYRVLPAVEFEGTEDETEATDDGTYTAFEEPLVLGGYTFIGATVCTACYVTLTLMSSSGRGLLSELPALIKSAWAMEPATLPRIA